MDQKQLQYILALPSNEKPRLNTRVLPLSPPQMGCCRFCGQVHDIRLRGCMDQDEADEIASLACDCYQGMRYQAIKSAEKKIEQLFGTDKGYKESFNEETLETLKDIAMEVYDETFNKFQVELSPTVKCKIYKNIKKEYVVIERIDTNKNQQTI